MEKSNFSYLPSTEAPMRKDNLFTASTVIKTSLSSLYDSKTITHLKHAALIKKITFYILR